MNERIDYFLVSAGFIRIQSNKEELVVYYQDQFQFVSVILLLDLQSGLILTPDTYLQIKRQIAAQFRDKGYENVHMLSMMMSRETERTLAIIKEDSFSWILDTVEGRLVIPEDHAEDFYGIRSELEKSLRQDPFEGSETGELMATKQKIPFMQRAFVNHGLVIANLGVFVICMFTGDLLYNIGILYARQVVEDGRWYQIFTSMFLHDPSDVNHIFGNMVLLFLLGDVVERMCGHGRYLMLYLVSGIMGNVLSLMYSYLSHDFVGSLGASGAVYGVVGALLWILIRNRGRVEDITLPRTIFMIAYSLYLGFTSSNVNNAAHVGGILTGFVLGILIYTKKERDYVNEC